MKKTILTILFLLTLTQAKEMQIYESPTCGCCDLWADYMKAKGYEVVIPKSDSTSFIIPPTHILGSVMIK